MLNFMVASNINPKSLLKLGTKVVRPKVHEYKPLAKFYLTISREVLSVGAN